MILRARGVLPLVRPALHNGAVVIEGDRIREVGEWPAVRATHRGPVCDLGEVILLPGLVNAHCHLDYTDLGGQLGRPRRFPDWVKEMVTLKSGWGYSDYAQSWIHGARQLLQSGVTTVADVEAVPELLPEVWETTPLRVISLLELLNVRHWHAASRLVRDAEATLTALPGWPARTGLSPHAPYSTSPDLLRHAADAARRRGWLLAVHVAESREEFDMFTRGSGALYDWLAPQCDVSGCGGASPVRYLAQNRVLGPNCLAVHANYLTDGDARLLAEAGASVVHCPRSHEFFRHERFPLAALQAAGVNVCLGTDSLASVVRSRREPMELNLFSEMRAFAAREPERLPEAILRMATLNGARALGREGELGRLCPGALADLIAVPCRSRTHDLAEAVLQHQGPVAASMIGGRWVIPPAM